MEHITYFVPSRPRSIRASHVGTGREDLDGTILLLQRTHRLQFLPYRLVQRSLGSVVCRNDDRVLRLYRVGLRDGGDALFGVGDFGHSTLLLQQTNPGRCFILG